MGCADKRSSWSSVHGVGNVRRWQRSRSRAVAIIVSAFGQVIILGLCAAESAKALESRGSKWLCGRSGDNHNWQSHSLAKARLHEALYRAHPMPEPGNTLAAGFVEAFNTTWISTSVGDDHRAARRWQHME